MDNISKSDKACGYCGEPHDRKGKYCSDSCKMKDYRRRNTTVTESEPSVTVETLRFEDLPFDVRIQINATARNQDDWNDRVERAIAYQAMYPERKNTSTICASVNCQKKNADLAVRPVYES